MQLTNRLNRISTVFKEREQFTCSGFTLTELMIVVAVLSALAIIATPKISRMVQNAQARLLQKSLITPVRLAFQEVRSTYKEPDPTRGAASNCVGGGKRVGSPTCVNYGYSLDVTVKQLLDPKIFDNRGFYFEVNAQVFPTHVYPAFITVNVVPCNGDIGYWWVEDQSGNGQHSYFEIPKDKPGDGRGKWSNYCD